MPYVDGFVVAVPKQNIEEYKAMARKLGAIWKEYGALAFVECLADDVPYGELTSVSARGAGEGGRDRRFFLDRLR